MHLSFSGNSIWLVFIFLISTCITVMAQNKKEQIQILENRVDSLNKAIETFRVASRDNRKVREEKLATLRKEISQLDNEISNLSGSESKISNELASSRKKFDQVTSTANILSKNLRQRSDSLRILTDNSEPNPGSGTHLNSGITVKVSEISRGGGIIGPIDLNNAEAGIYASEEAEFIQFSISGQFKNADVSIYSTSEPYISTNLFIHGVNLSRGKNIYTDVPRCQTLIVEVSWKNQSLYRKELSFENNCGG